MAIRSSLACAQLLRAYSGRPRRGAAKRDNEFSPPDMDCHAILPPGSGGDDITPGRAALRDFKPAYVGSGSFSTELVWTKRSLRSAWGRTLSVDGSFLKWLFNFLTGAVGYKQAASVEKGSAAFLVP
jgi:hypothetical protein